MGVECREFLQGVNGLFEVGAGECDFSDMGEAERELIENISFLMKRVESGEEGYRPGSSEGKVVMCIGQFGVGKSQLMRLMQAEFGGVVSQESWDANPFFDEAYSDAGYMLRSQLFFLWSGIRAGLDMENNGELNLFDTSTWSDWLVFARQKYLSGQMSEPEWGLYRQLVDLLEPLIVKPDVMLVVLPDSVEKLEQGIRGRAEQEPARVGELAHLGELEVLKDLTREAGEEVKKRGIEVVELVVDPLRIYPNGGGERERLLEKLKQIAQWLG